jgi:hypothetical protein
MRYILSFKTTFPEPSDFEHPKGYSICGFIQAELARLGFKVNPPENYRDIAWSVDCVIDSKKVFFFVGYLGTEMTDWQLIVCSGTGVIGKILGHKDDEERLRLAKAIHAILAEDDRFSDLKWFSRYTDTAKDTWCEQPEGAKR